MPQLYRQYYDINRQLGNSIKAGLFQQLKNSYPSSYIANKQC